VSLEWSQEENLIFQSYFTSCLFAELTNNKFIQSEYYDSLTFSDPVVKEQIRTLGVDNQGSLLMCLYAMLVVPKQLLETQHSDEFQKIREFLDAHAENTSTTYSSDDPTVDYLRHIRNAVAHARVSFRPGDVVVFQDSNGSSTFSTELKLQKVGEFLHRLQMVHVKHVQDKQREAMRERHSA
jgi:hypothetical protein